MPSGRNDARPLDVAGEQRRGVVIRIVNDRGFGFIREGDGRPGTDEYFFHRSNCYDGAWERILALCPEGKPVAACAVSFEATTTSKGLRAERVRVT